MKKYLKNIIKAQDNVMGINRRNIEFIYPNNSRRDYKVADDKALCKNILEDYGVPVPRTYILIEHLWELDDKLNQLEELDNFVVKPAMGSGGNGILILQKQGDGWLSPDGKSYNRERLKMHIAGILYGAYSHDHADKAILEERLVPHHFFRNIYDRGVPDVRIIVHDHIPIMAMLRIPTRSSKGKANLNQGALGIGVELETGKLGIGLLKQQRIVAHPDSGTIFKGLEIPSWKKFVSISRETASLVPLKYLGIDIIMDERLGPLVIEINARPGLQIQNSNRLGLLEALENQTGRNL